MQSSANTAEQNCSAHRKVLYVIDKNSLVGFAHPAFAKEMSDGVSIISSSMRNSSRELRMALSYLKSWVPTTARLASSRRCSVLSLRCSVLSRRYSVLSRRCSVLGIYSIPSSHRQSPLIIYITPFGICQSPLIIYITPFGICQSPLRIYITPSSHRQSPLGKLKQSLYFILNFINYFCIMDYFL